MTPPKQLIVQCNVLFHALLRLEVLLAKELLDPSHIGLPNQPSPEQSPIRHSSAAAGTTSFFAPSALYTFYHSDL
jgi:hypothetical protein